MGFFKDAVRERTEINDEVLVNNMLAVSTAGATAYLNATLTAATPELRAMYASSLSQILQEHSTLVELAVKKGWEKPYDDPTLQLTEAYSKSRIFVGDDD